MKKAKPFLNPPLDPAEFATTKYQWEDLRDIIDNKRFPIYRHVDDETSYRLYSQKLKQEWKSVYDFVLFTKFHFHKRLIRKDVDVEEEKGDRGDNLSNDDTKICDEKKVNETSIQSVEEYDYDFIVKEFPTLPQIPLPPKGYMWESYCPNNDAKDGRKEQQRILAKNDFPYYMEDGIVHWCLWKLGGNDVNDKDIQWAKDELGSRGDVLEMMHWINPVHLKSLPDIDHAHIICLMKKSIR